MAAFDTAEVDLGAIGGKDGEAAAAGEDNDDIDAGVVDAEKNWERPPEGKGAEEGFM